jgi:hypothetical protein
VDIKRGEETMIPFDRITVIIDGTEMMARPIEFINDEKGNPQRAVKWETVNPDTGQLIQFGIGDVTWVGEMAIWGKEVLNIKPNGGNFIKITDAKRIPVTELKSLGATRVLGERPSPPVRIPRPESVCPFLDPIEQGIYQIA